MLVRHVRGVRRGGVSEEILEDREGHSCSDSIQELVPAPTRTGWAMITLYAGVAMPDDNL